MYPVPSQLLMIFRFLRVRMRPFQIWFVCMCVLFATATASASSGPWHHVLTLRGEPSGLPMNMPSALFVDKERARYYVVDSANNRLLSFDRDGKFLNSFNAMGRLSTPVDMIREKGGVIWLVEKGKNSLTRIELKARQVTPNSLTFKGKAVYPDRLARHGDMLFVLDKATGDILCLDADLKVRKEFSCSNCQGGFVDFKIVGNDLFALNQAGQSIYRFALGDDSPAKVIQLQKKLEFPCSLDLDPLGNFFVLDRHGGCVAVFDKEGRFKYRFLRPGEAQGRLHFPWELSFDPWGRLCIVEEGNGRVEVFSR